MERIRMPDRTIKIATDFSRYPGGRFRDDGPNSGQEFREDFLVPALADAVSTNGQVVVTLDGAAAYASSFLEEAFGGLVRTSGINPNVVTRTVVIEAKDPLYASYKNLAVRYMQEEVKRLALAN